MVGGQRFFDRIEVKILLDYLRVVSHPYNNDALIRIINTPARGIGPATIKALLEEAELQKGTLSELIRNGLSGQKSTKTKISKAAEQGLSALVNVVMMARIKLLDSSNAPSPEALLRHIIKKLDYRTYLEKSYAEDHEARWANVEELLAQASEYRPLSSWETTNGEGDDDLPQIVGVEQESGGTAEDALSRFLANVALAAAADVAKEEPCDGDQAQSQVTVSTIHAAKGLEWPVVFIPSVYEGSIPHSRSEDTDEERRLLYVAMTRAQALLYMSFPVKNSQREETIVSPFLSTNNVGRLLANQAPTVNVPAVIDIARILRRDCPSGHQIEEGYRNLKSTRDDLWPLTGEESPMAVQNRRSKWDDFESCDDRQYPSKKCRIMNETGDSTRRCIVAGNTTLVGSSATMDNAAAFSYNGSIGFSSAAVQLQLARESASRTQKRILPEQKVKRVIEHSEQRRRERATLLNMWGIENKVEVNSKDLRPLDVTHCESIAAFSNPNLSKGSKEAASRTALASIPQGLAAHRLNPVIKKPAPSEYILLSSSPPEPEITAKKPDQRMAPTAEGATSIPRPAQTLHSTTTSQVQKYSNLAKKTLGVRRNMTGWSARPSNCYKAPKMVPKKN